MDVTPPSPARRDAFFAEAQRVLGEYYLTDPDNPYQQSGRSSGAARWEETRRCIADAVHRSGSFLDVGCANGLLLQTLAGWVGERGLEIEPHGVDFIEGLIALARRRVPHGTFWVANAWDWAPSRSFDFVRTNLEHVLDEDRAAFIHRQLGWVESGGRLIVCHYRDRGTPYIDVPAFLGSIGLEVGGIARADDPPVAWVDVAPSN